MAEITKPILLDETGQAINNTLIGIKSLMELDDEEIRQAGYDEGYAAGVAEGGYTEEDLQAKYDEGKQAEYDRFWDAYQLNGTRQIWQSCFCGAGWNEQTFNPKHKIVVGAGVTPASRMFDNFNRYGGVAPLDFTELSKKLDFSQANNATYTFASANIVNLTVDFSSLTSMTNTFNRENGGTLDFLTIKVSAKCTSFGGAFSNRTDTTTIIFTDDSVIAASLTFAQCTLLTKASITSVVNVLSTTATGKTVTFSKTAVNREFTDEEWATLANTRSNWTINLL